jgi:hypothetical protein
LTVSPYQPGDFVWSAYPERENPARPGPRHIGYIALAAGDEHGLVLFAAYTSSQPWRGPRPPGLYVFDQPCAAAMGQGRAFTLDLRRIAALRLIPEWLPDLDRAGHGIVGRAPDKLRAELEAVTIELFRRRPETIERLGPGWPGRRR